MATDIYLVKVNQGFAYLTDDDREAAMAYNMGDRVKAHLTVTKTRTLKHLRRYWGGLLEFTLQYWEPGNGMITDAEEYLVNRFAKYLDDNGGGGEVSIWAKEFLEDMSQLRANKAVPLQKSKSQLHEWIKEKLGYFDIISTPSGPRKQLASISFDKMDEDTFRKFYHDAFGLCWRYVLSKNFSDQHEVENAINNLLSLEG